MTDVNPFAIGVTLADLTVPDAKKSDGDEEVWSKQATIFKSFGKVGVKKTIAFTHDKEIHCGLDYIKSDLLPAGTELGLVRYNITGVVEFAKEMEEKGLGKPKVSLQFELSASGITSLIKAEAAVEETYTVEEEVEVDDDEASSENATDTAEGNDEKKDEEAKVNDTVKEDDDVDAKKDNATKSEKEKKKPKKKIMVQKVSRPSFTRT